jgi:hypothetical protein
LEVVPKCLDIRGKRVKPGYIYVIMRGINRQSLFEDDEDNEKFIETLRAYKIQRDRCIKDVRQKGLSVRQVSRLTSVRFSIVRKQG